MPTRLGFHLIGSVVIGVLKKLNLEKYCQKGERLYLTFLDGEDHIKTLGGQVIELIGDAMIFKVKTSAEYDRTIVIYLHRILKVEDIRRNEYVV